MKSFKDFISEAKFIKKDDKVRIKKEWLDPGEEKFEYIAVDDEEKGRVGIKAINTGLSFPPVNVVMRTMLEMVAGDSGGDATKIATGENSGSVVLGNRPKRKRKAKATPAEVGLPEKGLAEANISKAVQRMQYKALSGVLPLNTQEKERPEYKMLVALKYKPVKLYRTAHTIPRSVYTLGGKPDYDDVTNSLAKTGWKFVRDVPDREKDKGNWESVFAKKVDGVNWTLQVRDIADGPFLMDFLPDKYIN